MLAMLSVVATTFVMLTRLDVRITQNYVDDQRCDLLAYGLANYFKAVVRDDLDHTWRLPYAFRHANRTTGVGFYSKDYGDHSAPRRQIPGIVEYAWGTPVSNTFWFSAPWTTWGQSGGGGIYAAGIAGGYTYNDVTQQSFAWSDKFNQANGFIGRYAEDANYECDVWVGLANNARDQNGRHCATNYVNGGALQPIDDDADGVTNPDYDGAGFSGENSVVYDYLYDSVPLVMQSGKTGFQPGARLTGEAAMPGGTYWRWGVKIGPTHSTYANLNTAGNMDGIDAQWLANMGAGTSGAVGALRAQDEAADTTVDGSPNAHLGRIDWNGFPPSYDSVMFHPSAVNLERLLHRPNFAGVTGGSLTGDLGLSRDYARKLIRYRMTGDPNYAGVPVPGGGNSYRAGWRRDGASYFKFPSPENPLGKERYYGANEVIEHGHSQDNPATSAVAGILGDDPWRVLRPYVTMWSTDTILRGKIFPGEGGPGMGGYTATVGDWRNINILKRVNVNIIGANGQPIGLSGEQTELKARWAAKRGAEQTRLYYMLKAALSWGGFSGATQAWGGQTNGPMLACQFIAALSDMVDTDQNETCFIAPDGSGAWGLGYEKHPVINEVAFFSNSGANTANYALFRLRVELYNPSELIPWYPAADQAYDVSQYVLQVGTHYFRLGALRRFITVGNGWSDGGTIDASPNIGADGMYGMPVAGYYLGGTINPDPSWSRYVQVGWIGSGGTSGEFPNGVTYEELQGGPTPVTGSAQFTGVTIALWKPVNVPGAVPDTAYLVTGLGGFGGRYLMVDTTGPIQLVRPWNVTNGENGPGQVVEPPVNRNKTNYTGVYRRWDPMNGKIFTGTGGTAGGKSDVGNVLWCPGWTMARAATLGRPNTEYWPNMYSTDDPGTVGAPPTAGAGTYRRYYERNVKVVDGDIPSIGWLGELMMWNRAVSGPLTQIHATGQDPSKTIGTNGSGTRSVTANQLDTLAKFDLYRPFAPAGAYDPDSTKVVCKGLHILDMFTVWDPSNDGIDNDGDGAVDDDDTGLQAGDKYGPEVRVHGLIDLNQVPDPVMASVWPDNPVVRNANKQGYPIGFMANMRQNSRQSSYSDGIGPFETVGDILRADAITRYPGIWMSGSWYGPGPGAIDEGGFLASGTATHTDDDGDGIYDERDERDMMFTWMANYFTTRDNVFDLDLNVQICDPPYYPQKNGANLKLPWPAYKTKRVYAHKQFLGILDRSTCLRIRTNGACDFTGPVDLRLFRSSDDVPAF